jgi:hypothetical protein
MLETDRVREMPPLPEPGARAFLDLAERRVVKRCTLLLHPGWFKRASQPLTRSSAWSALAGGFGKHFSRHKKRRRRAVRSDYLPIARYLAIRRLNTPECGSGAIILRIFSNVSYSGSSRRFIRYTSYVVTVLGTSSVTSTSLRTPFAWCRQLSLFPAICCRWASSDARCTF